MVAPAANSIKTIMREEREERCIEERCIEEVKSEKLKVVGAFSHSPVQMKYHY
jgi:hypothetical protein